MSKNVSGFKTRLEPKDEYPHDPGPDKNYNESMYFNVFDPVRMVGGWFRIGNRPNEHYAESSVCLYLPGGRVGFIFGRPEISSNARLEAGGLSVEVIEPFKRLNVRFEGEILLMNRPADMANPRTAFKTNPRARCLVELAYEGVSPMFGGETVRKDGSPLEINPEESFSKAHYEQHCAARGFFMVGDERFDIDGFGLRDKSWGPRHWQAIEWYRWCPMNFGRDFGMMLSTIGDGNGGVREGGMVFSGGRYDLITECRIESDWDVDDYQTALRANIKTESGKVYEITGEILSLIPLRNRRKLANGDELQTRITEGMTRYRCGDIIGYGLSEYLDQIVGGVPNGKAAGY